MKNNTFIENNKIITIIAFLLFFLSIPVYADFTKTWENASPSVVSVLPTWPGYEKPGFGAPPGTAPEGSGVIISTDGIVVTASHVVSSATEVIVRDINGVKYDAEIIFNDVDTDLALLQTNIINKNIIIYLYAFCIPTGLLSRPRQSRGIGECEVRILQKVLKPKSSGSSPV